MGAFDEVHGAFCSLLTAPDRTRRESPKSHQQSPRPEPTQEVTPLLLLSIFAIAARFCEDEMPLPPMGKMWEAGCGYLDTARGLLGRSGGLSSWALCLPNRIAKVFHISRPSTVQALLLLGYREFGIGTSKQFVPPGTPCLTFP